MTKKEIITLRKKLFITEHEYDNHLVSIIKNYNTHKFLKNPSSQLIYQYLINYTIKFSEKHFKTDICNLHCLDWGSGKGHVRYFMSKYPLNITSCDVLSDKSDSTFGQDTPIIDTFQYNVDSLNHNYLLPYKNNSFDIVVSFGVLEHVENDYKSMKELNRILKHNGLLFIYNLPYIFSWTQNFAHLLGNYYHDRLYSIKKLRSLSKRTNYQILDFWHRQLFPKNSLILPSYKKIESFDIYISSIPPFKYFCTCLEAVLIKKIK